MSNAIFGLASIFSRKGNIKKYESILKKINKEGEGLTKLTRIELQSKIDELWSTAKKDEKTLISAFAICREASLKILGMKHYDVQVLGALALQDGKIAEMKTGEGKTLSASLAIFYKALIGEQTHLVTANDYLAVRDEIDLKPLYEFLKVRSSSFKPHMLGREKKKLYKDSHVIYSTGSEFTFDYLRDNTTTEKSEVIQDKNVFAIVDEVDSILIDEARNPFIISGEGLKDEIMVYFLNEAAPQFTQKWFDEKKDNAKGKFSEDLIIYEKNKEVVLTDNGYDKLEKLLVDANILPYEGALYETKNLYIVDRFSASVRGLYLFTRDVDYVVSDGEIVIINEQTGRLEAGKRWGDGLHQVVEAKEKIEIKPESKAIASTTLQNYFRIYDSISGMTGTAIDDAEEFLSVYGLEVVQIPTNNPMIRKDLRDRVYLTKKAKDAAIIQEIKEVYKTGRPILVGTASIEESEVLSNKLSIEGLTHNVLNAKNHLKEADIISQAGMPSTITIATNMAGRGTDIILGGNYKVWIDGLADKNETDTKAIKEHWESLNKAVVSSGGLHVIGTSRNESGRVDNQLKGRAGRQGDPGSSVFFVSIEDPLMRIFGGAKFSNIFKSMDIKEDECATHKFIDKGVRSSQRKLEEHNRNARKDLLKFDNITNIQRTHIYEMRSDWLNERIDDYSIRNKAIVTDVLKELFNEYMPKDTFEETWDLKGLGKYLSTNWGVEVDLENHLKEDYIDEDKIRQNIISTAISSLESMMGELPSEIMHQISSRTMISSLDQLWQEQMQELDNLKKGIHLRGFAQKEPLMEFKKESLKMFEEMMASVKEQYCAGLMLSLKSTIEANIESETLSD